jgi:hypothetical protein
LLGWNLFAEGEGTVKWAQLKPVVFFASPSFGSQIKRSTDGALRQIVEGDGEGEVNSMD